MKKLLVVLALGAIVSLNAGMVSAISGPNISENEYKNKDRGVIVDQDVDGDGIIDSEDDCLETIPCKKEGCQKKEKPKPVVIGDDDKDGVLNNIDQCPNTPAGFEVDEVGCSKLVNLEVLFERDSYKVNSNFTERLDIFIEFMNKHPKYNAQIQGHTDSRASEKYNEVLSQNRANAVKEYLVEQGIEENRLSSIGFGELSPIDTNDTAQGRANNRRVVAVLKK